MKQNQKKGAFLAIFYLALGALVLTGAIKPYKEFPEKDNLVSLEGSFETNIGDIHFSYDEKYYHKVCKSYWINENLIEQLLKSDPKKEEFSIVVDNASLQEAETTCIKLYEIKKNNIVLLSKSDVASYQKITWIFFKVIGAVFIFAGLFYLNKYKKSK